MKTVFITSFHAHISRNILATDVLKILKAQKELRVVLVVPNYKVDYFKGYFGGGNVIVHGMGLYQASKNYTAGLFFKRLELMLGDSETRRLKKRYKFYRDKKLLYFLASMAVGFTGHSYLVRKLIRRLDFWFSPKEFFLDAIDRYQPSLIFSTDIFDENDVSLMQAAKVRRVPILGMVRSWDNPSQYIMRILPDNLLVGSEEMKKEILELHDYPADRIKVVGQPHYDRYLRGPTKSKKEFFSEFGLDTNKPLIFFTPLGDKFVKVNDIDQYAMSILGTLNAQILVRFPPDEKLTLVNFVKPPNMVIDKPGAVFKEKEFTDREIRREDDDRLINSIYWSDVVISGPTSICLDGAFFDKPIVAVHLYPTPRSFFDGVYCYCFTHIQKLLKTKGIRYVTTKEELFSTIQEYLRNPKSDREGRERIRVQWFSHADGTAAERVATAILVALGKETASGRGFASTITA